MLPEDPLQLDHPLPFLNQAVSAKQLNGVIPWGEGGDEVGAQGQTPSLKVVA